MLYRAGQFEEGEEKGETNRDDVLGEQPVCFLPVHVCSFPAPK